MASLFSCDQLNFPWYTQNLTFLPNAHVVNHALLMVSIRLNPGKLPSSVTSNLNRVSSENNLFLPDDDFFLSVRRGRKWDSRKRSFICFSLFQDNLWYVEAGVV